MVRTLVGLALALCLVAFGGTASALPGQTKTVPTAPPKTVGKTTFTETETTQDFGTVKTPNWKRIETNHTSETPDPNDSTTINRTIDIRKYANGSKRTTETVHTEETEGLMQGFVRGIKKSKSTTTTYGTVGGKRKKVK
ncbi:MAG: hypothetical protein JRH10_12350, partial [Deltaproteobacteria bacterium]|nr:hypothetical protein [Deltaproteobacteria bacterium]